MPSIPKRIRYFVAVEGESEQSFVRWLQYLADAELHIHLDTYPLGGGGFASMLEKTVNEHKKRAGRHGTYKNRFLIIDADRANSNDWPLDQLRAEAHTHHIKVIVQRPNHEGLLYRIISHEVHDIPVANAAQARLRRHWEHYEKPADAAQLRRHLNFDALIKVADVDPDVETLLRGIGLIR
ncbi:MAG: hypothetical protein LV479_11055 [Methylacidiphilales bacterium]|nr:hypothetical protein [Candidatus Methylacidiphilales bacterium]